ncbi:hypothetical protein BD311DRAFT_763857 [Dichomitus squalens]|uniref:Uncharacterized protein n=1 Tax=Dichomitus squalens TaxID=114155 RepID=A0A4Q9MEN0_9APHY|nr:hypothetical protein BD311DRAFT_763857 [Dichomitus squalens]
MSGGDSAMPVISTPSINEFAFTVAVYFAGSGTQSDIQLFVASVTYGFLTALVVAAIIFLARQGLSSRYSVSLLLLSTLILYTSTTVYMCTLVWSRLGVGHLISEVTNGVVSATYDPSHSIASLERNVKVQSWMMTATGGLNILIGDGVVWWRACVVWRNRIVYIVGPLLLTLTLVIGVLEVHKSETGPSLHLQILIGVDGFADAFVVLTMSVNILATSLIAYKAWGHRRLLQKHVGSDGTKTRTLKALALLVESGTIYCALLIFLVVYQLSRPLEVTSNASAFAQTGWYLTDGCLFPITAIYPTTIIVIVAMNRSPIDHGVSHINEAKDTAIIFNHSMFSGQHMTSLAQSESERHSGSEDRCRL